ncbi:magnesium chelatase subunit D [Sphingomonas sp. BIUV-7]|uniref:Magnesium chelatase subunit D n=1 Tax=Sphingomonas natans TaxID=3063330 RepID=A0ABT8YEJ7_9SPHN|nr:magnesium chelatase subunit D [Sphingomonas sp. BIUV-7]MDO6416203.1 magnesium chelatase subunit D [Sphingomonas sp. BIUV-7]
MIASSDATPNALADAILAARLCAIDPRLCGLVLRGDPDARNAVIAALQAGLPADVAVRRVPLHVDDERLLGGIDLTETLARGEAVSRIGLLAEADGGMLVLPMADRLSDATAARIAAVIDTGEVVIERDGIALRAGTRFVTVVLDDGIEPEEGPPAALVERMAFWIDLEGVRSPGLGQDPGYPVLAPEDDRMLEQVGCEAAETPELLEVVVRTAAVLGIDSIRPVLFALRAARASAKLARRCAIADADLTLAARLVLAPRATRMPAPADETPSEPPPPSQRDDGEEDSAVTAPIEDIVLAAALAALPKNVLARIAAGRSRRGRNINARGGGERRKSSVRGRPMGARAGVPGGGQRLALIDTLRAAAPWQTVRKCGPGRVAIRRDDLRVRRFETRAEAVTIFAVDASGSSALARLAEAKGAVELLLAEAYVKRAQVALVAFRGSTAEIVLPPTRSLARARRSLADLPGGGGTPLAAGLNAARDLAEAARARGRTPFVVILTDGRANIAADGSAVRNRAQTDATSAAKAVGAAGIPAAFIDISARSRPEGAALAAAMGARYLPLPRADATAVHAAISQARKA